MRSMLRRKTGSGGGKMLLRFTLKNMFEKPLRLFVLLLCVTVASFAGCLAIDIGGTL